MQHFKSFITDCEIDFKMAQNWCDGDRRWPATWLDMHTNLKMFHFPNDTCQCEGEMPRWTKIYTIFETTTARIQWCNVVLWFFPAKRARWLSRVLNFLLYFQIRVKESVVLADGSLSVPIRSILLPLRVFQLFILSFWILRIYSWATWDRKIGTVPITDSPISPCSGQRT